jgi:hypothetical protein
MYEFILLFRVLLRVRTLFYLKHEVLGDAVDQIDQGKHVRYVEYIIILLSYIIYMYIYIYIHYYLFASYIIYAWSLLNKKYAQFVY